MRNYAVLSNRELAEELRERLRLGGGGAVVLSATQVQEIIKRLPKTKPPGHLRGERRNEMPVTDLTDKELVERAVRNAKPNIAEPSPRWVAVMDSFGLGSTYSYELCRQYGLNPDEKIDGVRCISCDP